MLKLEHKYHEEFSHAPLLPFISELTGTPGGKVRSAGGAGADPHRQSRWALLGPGSNGEPLGVRRLARYTVRPGSVRKYDRLARGGDEAERLQQQGGYLPGDSDEYFAQQNRR